MVKYFQIKHQLETWFTLPFLKESLIVQIRVSPLLHFGSGNYLSWKLSYTSQLACQQHPWTLPTGCQQYHPLPIGKPKMSPWKQYSQLKTAAIGKYYFIFCHHIDITSLYRYDWKLMFPFLTLGPQKKTCQVICIYFKKPKQCLLSSIHQLISQDFCCLQNSSVIPYSFFICFFNFLYTLTSILVSHLLLSPLLHFLSSFPFPSQYIAIYLF